MIMQLLQLVVMADFIYHYIQWYVICAFSPILYQYSEGYIDSVPFGCIGECLGFLIGVVGIIGKDGMFIKFTGFFEYCNEKIS